MGSFLASRIDIVEFPTRLRFPGLPLAIDDTTLAHHLGLNTSTIWWLIHTKDKQYTVFEIDKRGKRKGRDKREIQNPSPRLKTVQKLLLGRFLAPIPVGKHIGAYVPGRSCVDTARQHVGKGIIVSMDLKDFFPSVKRAMIRRYFNWVGYPHRVSSLLAELMTYKNFVPQGAPTSGYISNLVADNRFDQLILSDLKNLDPRWCYTRYSDDIDVSNDEVVADTAIEAVIALVRRRVNEAGFQLNEEKTKVEPQWRRQKVLGVVVNKKINIPRVEYMRIRALIHNCLVHGFDIEAKRAGQKNVTALIAYIKGKLSYFDQIDHDKASKLREQLLVAIKAQGLEHGTLEVDFGTNFSDQT